MPGDDAVLQFGYHKVVRSLIAATTEWERVSGTNFVHVAEDDTPGQPPHLSVSGANIVARADCGNGTSPYFGVIAPQLGPVQGITNVFPQRWNDPSLEPLNNALTRTIAINSSIVLDEGDDTALAVMRHELGHVMGFAHEEINLQGQAGDGCTDQAPRPLTPVDDDSVLATPGCDGLADSELLSHGDRLSAFFLHHSPRSRFETRPSATGYRYSGLVGGGSEILWHSDGSNEGVLWRPEEANGALSFVEEPFVYATPDMIPAGGWYPNRSEIVIPLDLGGDSSAFDLLFFGPGPEVDDHAIVNTGGVLEAVPWPSTSFAVPVIGRFDGEHLDRDVAYLYQPGTNDSVVVAVSGASVSVLTEVPQQLAHAYPLAAPYRGTAHPDDIIWVDPQAETVSTWRLGSGMMNLLDTATVGQGELGLASGENIPVVGDFNGDGRADVLWHGVSNLAAGLPEIVDTLWLSQSTADTLAFATSPKEVGRSYRPFVGDFDGDGIDDVFWHRSWGMTSDGPSVDTTGPSFIWYFDAGGGHEARAFALGADVSPYVGDFDSDSCHDIAWFDPTEDTMSLWRCLPHVRDFECGPTLPTPPDAAPVGVHWGF